MMGDYRSTSSYVGRLAPSPTGDLHLGIARTCLIAWLDARAHNGVLRLRFEDIDGPRVVHGSAEAIQRDLAWLGIDWDGECTYQSQREDLYIEALNKLKSADRTYPCTCSRRDIKKAASAPHDNSEEGPRYPQTCRNLTKPRQNRPPSIRLKTYPSDWISFEDRFHGHIRENVYDKVGDFIVRRSDKLWAYQFAVTVDDLEQGINNIIRGDDLLGSTSRQLLIRTLLSPQTQQPVTLHVPLIYDENGKRLAKRNQATSLLQIKQSGTTKEQLLGQFGHDLHLIEKNEPTSIETLLDAWREKYSIAKK